MTEITICGAETGDHAADNKNTLKRQSFLDMLRIATTCAVVMLHTITGIKDTTDMSAYPAEFKIFLIIMDFTTWCVPVFIMISGYLFLNPARKISYNRIIFKYCRRIILALIIFGVPYACLELVINEHSFRPEMIGRAFIMVCLGQSWSHMWYLYLVLLLYLITPPLKYILGKIPGKLIYTILALIYIFGGILPFIKKLMGYDSIPALPDETIYIFYYLCGYLFACHSDTKAAHYMFRSAVIKAAALAAVLLLACMTAIRVNVQDSVQLPYNYPFTVPLSLLIFFLALNTGKVWQKYAVLLEKLGSLSFTIYLIHPVFLNIAYKFLKLSLLDYPVVLSVPIFFAAVLALSVPAAWLLRKIPGMSEYVL
ncbi:MAG: acyltransferase [Lachnospiraceae bacterium]|nr:acyltransferase [Lachnospiraceae bacterium]